MKIVLGLISILVILTIPQVFAQVSIGDQAKHISLEITIEHDGNVHVIHLVKKSNAPIQVDTISGTVKNLKVNDANGADIQHAIIGNDEGVMIFPTNENLIVEYDLNDALFLNDDIWTWNFFYPVESVFIFPDKVDLVFVNNNPAQITENGGIRCHGCQMKLEYMLDEPIFVNEVKWEEQKFPVSIRTIDEINSFNFDQSLKRISFETNEGNRFITMIIPQELLWNPYEVFLEGEKIFRKEFSQNGTHVWLYIKPETSGLVEVIGTSVIPEFTIMLPLVLGITIVVGLQLKNKINLR